MSATRNSTRKLTVVSFLDPGRRGRKLTRIDGMAISRAARPP